MKTDGADLLDLFLRHTRHRYRSLYLEAGIPLRRYLNERSAAEDEDIADILYDIDHLPYDDYVYLCMYLMMLNGFRKVMDTPPYNRHGADIIAYSGKHRYAVRCPEHLTEYDMPPFEEVIEAKEYYDCDEAVIMTDSRVTVSHEGVSVWDRIVMGHLLSGQSPEE